MKNIKIYWLYILKYGLILSIIFTAIILLSYLIDPMIWIADFPEEVQQQVGEMTPAVMAKSIFVMISIMLVTLLYCLLLNRKIIQDNITHATFLNLLLNSFLLLNFMNLFDAIVVDIFIFGLIQPDFMWIKGAEEYIKETVTATFHFIGFLKGQPYLLFIAAIATAISLRRRRKASKVALS